MLYWKDNFFSLCHHLNNYINIVDPPYVFRKIVDIEVRFSEKIGAEEVISVFVIVARLSGLE